MNKIGRDVEKGESDGFMKVLADAETKEILGVTILGTGGDEAIHCILTAMYAPAGIAPAALGTHSSDSRRADPRSVWRTKAAGVVCKLLHPSFGSPHASEPNSAINYERILS